MVLIIMKTIITLKNFFKNSSVRVLSAIPVILAILLLSIWVVLRSSLIKEIPSSYNYIVLSIASLLTGVTGIVYIYKKEMPGFTSSTTIKGEWAILSGVITVIFLGGLGFLMIYYILTA